MDSDPGLLWQLYVEALERGLRIPPGQDFLAASEMPLALNTATTIDPVPLPEALAEVYRLGNTMPAWKPFYQPTAAGRVFEQYQAFVYAIAVPPEGGAQYRPVRQARQLLREVDEQIKAGWGSLVMAIATASGDATVPRYDSGPLGNPGYSQWLELAILAVAHGLPPQVDVTVRSQAAAGRRQVTPPGALPALLAPFAGLAAGEIVALRLTIQSTTYLPLQAGRWFVASLLSTYTRPQDFLPGTPFAGGPIWGPDGIFNLLATGLHAGFRSQVEVTVTAAAYARAAARAGRRLRAGHALALDPERAALAVTGSSLQGMLLGMVVDAPNWPQGPQGSRATVGVEFRRSRIPIETGPSVGAPDKTGDRHG